MKNMETNDHRKGLYCPIDNIYRNNCTAYALGYRFKKNLQKSFLYGYVVIYQIMDSLF